MSRSGVRLDFVSSVNDHGGMHVKSIFLGEAISDARLKSGEVRMFPEPDGAPEIRRVQGLAALLMEGDCPPATLSDLRSELLNQDMTNKERLHAGYAIMELLASDILQIAAEDRTLEYYPPQTQQYADYMHRLEDGLTL